MNYFAHAIQNLCPGAEFSIIEEDLSTIKWDKKPKVLPTLDQIEAEIIRIKEEEKLTQADKAAAKAALLERLGMTAEEAALLLG
jgi:hypothetical protein